MAKETVAQREARLARQQSNRQWKDQFKQAAKEFDARQSLDRFKQEQITKRHLAASSAEGAKAGGQRLKGISDIIGSTAFASQQVRSTTKWLWSGLSIVVIILLIAGPGTAVILQLFGSLGIWFWVLLIMILILVWRYR